MTKQIITFNIPYASVTSYDTAAGLNDMRAMAGVKDVQMYHATAGQPSYMLIVDVEDDKESAVRAYIEDMMKQYASYLQDVTIRSFRPLS
jgi:hypothetical protein